MFEILANSQFSGCGLLDWGLQSAGSPRDAYRMIGNGVSVPVGQWLGSEIKRYFE